MDSDLLLLLLRDLLASGHAPHLRIVLMSATADAELFARYFTVAVDHQQVLFRTPALGHGPHMALCCMTANAGTVQTLHILIQPL